MPDIFTVVADPTRREILDLLLDRRARNVEASVTEIVDALGVTQPTVSKHLKVLREAGLALVREDGQHRYYSIDVRPLDELDDWLMPFIFSDDEEHGEAALGAAAFAAWAEVTGPLRQAAEQARNRAGAAREAVERVANDPRPFGESVGRKAADVMHSAKSKVHDAQERFGRH